MIIKDGLTFVPFRYYNDNAEKAFEEYQKYDSDQLYQPVKPYLQSGIRVLDIGAGSGRDAAWYSQQGCIVTAVEPAERLMALGRAEHSAASIEWFVDSLPDLLLLKDRTFDFIHLSGVWMHIAPDDRISAMNRICGLLAHKGYIYTSIRHGDVDKKGRQMYQTPDDDPIFSDKRLDIVFNYRRDECRNDTPTVWSETILQKK